MYEEHGEPRVERKLETGAKLEIFNNRVLLAELRTKEYVALIGAVHAMSALPHTEATTIQIENDARRLALLGEMRVSLVKEIADLAKELVDGSGTDRAVSEAVQSAALKMRASGEEVEKARTVLGPILHLIEQNRE